MPPGLPWTPACGARTDTGGRGGRPTIIFAFPCCIDFLSNTWTRMVLACFISLVFSACKDPCNPLKDVVVVSLLIQEPLLVIVAVSFDASGNALGRDGYH